MNITLEFLKQKEACEEGLDYLKANNLEEIEAYKLINKLNEDNKLDWNNWLLSKLFTHENCIKYAIYSAELVLHIFEDKYPDDKRPRLAIKAAKKYLKTPTKKNKEAAGAAAWDAGDAGAAAWDAGDAGAAARAAGAARAADRAAGAAAWAARAAGAAARAAARAAAWDAGAAAYNKLLQNIIDYGVELLKEQEKHNEQFHN